jgi:hypothetical protein
METASLAPTFLSAGALVVALGALTINLREHREFMRRLRARARFKVRVRTVDADDDGIRWTERTLCSPGWRSA